MKLKNLFKIRTKSSCDLIGELFDATATRQNDLGRATMVATTCLHEGGHMLMAEVHNIPINWINLPDYDRFFKRTESNETNEEKKKYMPGVGIPRLPAANADTMVSYLLGGIFGELNIYHDNVLRHPRRFADTHARLHLGYQLVISDNRNRSDQINYTWIAYNEIATCSENVRLW